MALNLLRATCAIQLLLPLHCIDGGDHFGFYHQEEEVAKGLIVEEPRKKDMSFVKRVVEI